MTSERDAQAPAPDFLHGGGECGALMRAMDWSATPLGPVSSWPQSLRTTVSLLLNSRYPMFVFWGPELVKIYNDGYRPITGNKHPWAMGRPAREVWPEIWPDIVPLIERAMSGEATWSDDFMLFMERNGFPEEVYFTFSYSPVRDESGGVAGMFCACTETTGNVLGARRLRALNELSSRPAGTATVDEVCAWTADVLRGQPADVPFALLYLTGASSVARLACTAGVVPGAPAAPREIGPHDAAAWPVLAVAETGTPLLLADLSHLAAVPAGPWPEPPRRAMLLPLTDRASPRPVGVLVLGASSRRPFDDAYRGFFGLLAGQVASLLADARAADQIRQRAEALAALDRAKTVFFSDVSHEFRTPLALLLGPLEEALSEAVHPVERERLDMAYRNALRLLRLVNSLLDFSRLEAGRIDALYEPVDLGALTADLASAFRSACEKAGLALEVRCEPLGPVVWVDRGMWEKVVLNLVSNAFKFTLHGGIRVTQEIRGDAVELRVGDTGCGIPEEQLPRIFDRFHRVPGARGRTHEGSGIGLALVQELVALHGGSVSVTSREGEGAEFCVAIPLGTAHLPAERVSQVPATQPAARPRGSVAFVEEALRWMPVEEGLRDSFDAPGPATGGRRPRIVLADDNADMRAYLMRLLESRYDVEPTGDGESALAAVRRQRPDLVLADVMMPRLDGLGLLRAVRADPALRTMPVLLLSARAGEEARIDGLAAGADDYLTKPFSARELMARVAAVLEVAAVRQEAEDALRQADVRKDEFLATLAHELRNPLAPIRNAVSLLCHPGGVAHPERLYGLLERQVSHLVRLVDDLMDVSRITRGVIELRREPVAVADVVQAAVEASRPALEAARHHLEVELPAEPVHLHADPVRLSQVIGNLLHNAAKYTDPGGAVTVSARAEDGTAILSVRDTGVGIPAAMLPRVFDLFTQVETSRARAQGGLGIGLTLARQLVELHGGTIEARSAGEGHGTEVIVRLPVAEHVAPAVAPTVAATPDRVRVLVVDDNHDSADSLVELLAALGADAAAAYDGVDALDAADRLQPSMVLLDLGMPGMDGYEVASRLRERVAPLYVVALTGWGQPADRERTSASGFDGHLVKPVDLDALKLALGRAAGA